LGRDVPLFAYSPKKEKKKK